MDKKKYSADFFISVITIIAFQNSFIYNTAEMAELVDAPDSKSGEG